MSFTICLYSRIFSSPHALISRLPPLTYSHPLSSHTCISCLFISSPPCRRFGECTLSWSLLLTARTTTSEKNYRRRARRYASFEDFTSSALSSCASLILSLLSPVYISPRLFLFRAFLFINDPYFDNHPHRVPLLFPLPPPRPSSCPDGVDSDLTNSYNSPTSTKTSVTSSSHTSRLSPTDDFLHFSTPTA